MLIDSHCHLHDKEFFTTEEAEKCIARANKAGVEKIICIGTNHEDSLAARDFAEMHDNVYWTYGIHPESAGREKGLFSERSLSPVFASRDGTSSLGNSNKFEFLSLRRSVVTGLGRSVFSTSENMLLEKTLSSRLVAIGEVGLDYHYEGYDREAQIKLFEQMLQLAQDNDLPVSFHVREAFADFFPVVENFPKIRGVVHSFTDSKKVLKRIINETEFYVGVNGLATYTTLATPPLERILLETDAPFLAPIPHRGEGNEPAYIADIAKWLSEKLEVSVDEVEKTTTNNCNKLFKL